MDNRIRLAEAMSFRNILDGTTVTEIRKEIAKEIFPDTKTRSSQVYITRMVRGENVNLDRRKVLGICKVCKCGSDVLFGV